MPDDPKWVSNMPERWETYYQAWYLIGNARPILVDNFCRSEKAAQAAAEQALMEKLEDVKKLGLSVEASAWTVKWQSRKQERRWPESNVGQWVVNDWYGTHTVIEKSVFETEKVRRLSR